MTTKRNTAGNRWHQLEDAEYNAAWIERVKARCVTNEKGCWIWPIKFARGKKYGTKWSYGQTNYRAKSTIIHRQMYKIVHGVVLGRFDFVCHSCDETMCCNPAHLWLGTPRQNSLDASSKGRSRNQQDTHCKRGHEFTPENTYMARRNEISSSRACKTCQRIRQRIKAGWTPEEAAIDIRIPFGYSRYGIAVAAKAA